MIIGVRAAVSANSITIPAKNSKFWILAKGVPHELTGGESSMPSHICTDLVIPAGVTLVKADLQGASGGGEAGGHGPTVASAGKGGRIIALVPATAGHTWRFCTGGAGGADGNSPPQGFNGGGFPTQNGVRGSGGGGMTSIYNMTLGIYLLIAGGGGGGGHSDVGGGGAGGHGGWPAGGTGGASAISGGAPGGAGGTQSAGPQQFQGDLTASTTSGTTQGGGGGWWGGFAGGSRTGGGGGSSWFNAALGVIMIANESGVQYGDGTATYMYV